MEMVTEAQLRRELEGKSISTYGIPQGKILSPMAKSYLQQRGIEVVKSVEKPVYMTHRNGRDLVEKNHPQIQFRGKLDSLQALIVLAQTQLPVGDSHEKLEEVLKILRQMMVCEVMEQPLEVPVIFGLTHGQLRQRSHDPKAYYNVEPMTLPSHTMGVEYALLNQIRTAIRETELVANSAFRQKRMDILEVLNRLSSALHILMCQRLEEGL